MRIFRIAHGRTSQRSGCHGTPYKDLLQALLLRTRPARAAALCWGY